MKGAHNGHDLQQCLRMYEVLFQDLVLANPELKVELDRDLSVIRSRCEKEGISFLTKTLPRFGKAIDVALSKGSRLTQCEFHSQKAGAPAFLRGYLRRIFDRKGNLLANPDPGSVLEVRQLCLLFYKKEMRYATATCEEKERNHIIIDSSLPLSLDSFDSRDKRVLGTASAVLAQLFPRDPGLDAFIPHHGPGAVAGGEKSFEKMNFDRYFSSIDSVFSYDEFYFLSPSHLSDELDKLLDMPDGEPYSKACFVPKDSRGPRMIAMEPKEFMWVQQAIKAWLYDYIEKNPLTKGFINFTSQDVNRNLAKEASITREWDTLDLSDASDRVANVIVETIFPSWLNRYLQATRTCGCTLSSGRKVTYRKFAPMGSALCFPIEALTFWALIIGILKEYMGVPITIGRRVYVYGDDIILRSNFTECVVQHLPAFGLKLNESKCCTTGPFRESCGCDAIDGVDVTPIKVKHWPSTRKDVRALVSLTEVGNNFYSRGYFHVSDYIKTVVEGFLGPLPISDEKALPLVWWSRTGIPAPVLPLRWCKSTHRWLVRAYAPQTKRVKHKLSESWSGLFSSIVQGATEDGPDVHPVRNALLLRKKWRRFAGMLPPPRKRKTHFRTAGLT